MSTATPLLPDFDVDRASLHQVADRLIWCETEIKSIVAKGDNATPDELDRGDQLADLFEKLRARKDNNAARFKKLGETAAGLDAHLRKPAGGMVHADAGGLDTKAANDKGVAVGNRLDAVATKSAPWEIFRDKGGFFDAVKRYSGPRPERDAAEKMGAWEDMQKKITPAGLYEGSDPDGGVLVPSETSTEIYSRAMELENLWTRVDNITVRGNTMTFPKVNDKSRIDGQRSGGVVGYWEGEGETLTPSKPSFGLDSLRLKKLAVAIVATDELLSDSPFALASYLTTEASKEIAFKINAALITGTGVGMPLGILKSGALLVVPAATGQGTKTIVTQNINDMYMRLYAPYRKGAVWMVNQDVESTFQGMSSPVGLGGQLTYMPPGGISGTPYATLKGLPVIVVEQCSTLGTVGDIILANWGQYRAISKGGVDSAMSMHVRFLTDEMTFRFLFRADGQPKWGEPLTAYNGTTTYSPFVALATR